MNVLRSWRVQYENNNNADTPTKKALQLLAGLLIIILKISYLY